LKTIQIESVSFDELLHAIDKLIETRLESLIGFKEPARLLTRKQIKDQYGISFSTIHRYVTRGFLVPKRLGGKVYFDQESINKAMK
jgi:predicted DNA-binding transcriptional regulator AlpA